MYTKILVPLDGSRLAEGVLPYVVALGKAFRIPAELLQVIDSDTIHSFIRRNRVEDELKQSTSSYLQTLVSSISSSIAVDWTIEIGRPASAIVDRAAVDKAALITMATHGRSGIGRWFLGSVADKVLEASKNPLLLVRATRGPNSIHELPFKKLIVCLDGSQLAELTLPHVVAIGRATAAEIVLLRVYTPTRFEFYHDTDTKVEIAAYLERKVTQLENQGLDRVSCLLEDGNAAPSIIELSGHSPNSLVIMSARGRSAVEEGWWLLGSVAERVVKHCSAPVLVIPTPQTGE